MDEVFYQTFVPAMQVALHLCKYRYVRSSITLVKNSWYFKYCCAPHWPDVVVGLVGMRLLDLVLALSILV